MQYTLDAAGNPVALTDAPGQTSPVETYQYDPLYRLQQVDEAGAPWQAYTYDKTGDRLTKTTVGVGTDTYQYQGGTHRLIGIAGAEPSIRTVDANGNTTSLQSPLGGTSPLTYNDANRLASIEKGTGTTQYFLNGKGERVRKQQSYVATSSNYIYDQSGHLLAEYRDLNGTSTDYIWADGAPVALYWGHGPAGASQLRYVLTDGLGTPRVATTPSQTTEWTWPAEQNPFGERDASRYGGYLNLRFPGQYFDAETGLHYNMFRDYEPGTGRYVESDPIGLGGGTSTYSYVAGTPLRYSDWFGLLVWITSGPSLVYDYGAPVPSYPGLPPQPQGSSGGAYTTATWKITPQCMCRNDKVRFDQYVVDFHSLIHMMRPQNYPDGDREFRQMIRNENQHDADLRDWANTIGRRTALQLENKEKAGSFDSFKDCEDATRSALEDALGPTLGGAMDASHDKYDVGHGGRAPLHQWVHHPHDF